jgi:8-oxo-dGTP pyrophosphatase MutT (NUDIX family)
LRLYLTVTDADRIQPDEFLVESILKRRGTGRNREYKVKWRGYPIREATWEPRAPLMVRCSDMISAFDGGNNSAAAAPGPAAVPPVLPSPPAALPVSAAPAAPPAAVALVPTSDAPTSASPASAPSNNRHYRDSDYRLHSSKVAFFDPLTGEVYSHVRQRGGLDLPGGHRDQNETSAAAALLRECLSEELRVPATLATRLRKYAKRAPYVQVVPRRTAVHVVSLWLVPATPAELAGIEQTEEGRREAHSPAMRPFATFQAESPYAEALTEGLRALRFSKDLNRFAAAEEMTAEVAADQASPPPPADAHPPPPPTPDAAKYERGHWFYRLTFPSRKGSTTRWFPSSRYSASELEEMAPLRACWGDNLHLQNLPPSAIAAVVAAIGGLSVESTLNAHLLRCAFRDDAPRVALDTGPVLLEQPLAGC